MPISIGSVVSTFLISFGVVAAATVCVVVIALSDPDQPATLRRTTDRDRARTPRKPRPARPAKPVRPARVRPRRRREQARAWIRLRSGLALIVLVTFAGVVMAAVVGTSLALAARALRRAVG